MFAIATAFWGLVGMLIGVIIAFQFVFPALNFDFAPTTFGRLRPVHTNAVIFAFVGNGIFMGGYYAMQRLLKARMYSDLLSKIHFWGWQLIIVSAALTLLLGYTTGKEYAELEWPIDIAITLVWIVFGINLFGTMFKRRERHLYVGLWFFIGTWVTVAVLHVVNSFEMPFSWMKSYSLYAGVQDALVQWWYGHNAVAFFLTTPYLGLMYYYIPKAAGRPVYSYKWSIIHFWSLIFIYIWAGPHHLLYTALPDWAQSLGTVFSIMLILPSWGGMLNGLFTLRGAWDRVKEDPILKMFVVALTCYGMSTLEGPLLSTKNVNAVTHYTDWTVAHVHVGALGWNGFLTFGILYWLIPRLWNTRLYSIRWANTHFILGTIGIILYAIPMYWAGFSQGMMWKQFTEEGSLQYQFLETVTKVIPLYFLRAVGGTIYLAGAVLMVVNLMKTASSGTFSPEERAEALSLKNQALPNSGGYWHSAIERRPIRMLIFALIVVSIGGLFELMPTFLIKSNIPSIAAVKPYTPLELHGRDIYIREGCNTCHSQMIRPFRDEVARYGDYSKAGEFVYDHPFLWGSKRTGPDLHREGGKYPDSWHYKHMMAPAEMSQGSIMPAYPWLSDDDVDLASTKSRIDALRAIGVPYPEGYGKTANEDLLKQAKEITARLSADKIQIEETKEMVALIAYLQRLGTDVKMTPTAKLTK